MTWDIKIFMQAKKSLISVEVDKLDKKSIPKNTVGCLECVRGLVYSCYMATSWLFGKHWANCQAVG